MLSLRSKYLADFLAEERRKPLADAPDCAIEVEVIRGPDELALREAEWRRLVETAIEPNVFFEPAVLLPALTHLAKRDDPEIVLLYAQQKANRQAPRVLCGLLPILRRTPYRRWSLPGISTWAHLHCFLGTPLVRKDFGEPTLHALFDWLASQKRSPAIYMPLLHAGGAFAKALTTVLQQRASVWFVQKQIARSLFEPAHDAEQYRKQVWSRKARHTARRQKRHLEELGELRTRRLRRGDEIHLWLEAFLQLESKGWKGANQTAIQCDDGERNFFIEALTHAFESQRLQILSLELDGKPIAMNTAFYASEGGFYFKIAYDEEYRKYSPGVVLEAEFIDALHDRPELQWLDSCAVENHPMIERLWDGRRLVQSVWISNGTTYGGCYVSAIATMLGLRKNLTMATQSIIDYWKR